MNGIRNTPFAAALALLVGVGQASAATITFVGSDVDTTLGNWRTTTTAKPLDPDGDNVYGSDGYAVAYSGSTAAVLTAVPAYLSSLTNLSVVKFLGGQAFNYEQIDLASAPPGPAVADEFSGMQYDAVNTGSVWFDFVLNTAATFRVGIITDISDGIRHTPTNLTVSQIAGGVASATSNSPIDRNLLTDYYLFEISGNAGDEFRVAGTQGSQLAGIAGVFFDTVPEPGTLALLGLGGVLVARRRR